MAVGRISAVASRFLPVLLGLVGAVVAAAGSQVPSFWWDEAATVSMADRTPSEMVHALANVDAVHGVYYLVMHVWFEIFGLSELSARLPSALAVGVGTAALVGLTRKLAGSSAAFCAGVVFIVLPRTTWAGVEARSYAMVAAVAVVWTLTLVVCIRSGRRVLWVLYASMTALSVGLFLYSVTLVVAHAATVCLLDRRRTPQQLAAAAVGVAAVSPLIVLMVSQSMQVSWVPPLDGHVVRTVLVDQLSLENPVFAVVLALVVVVSLTVVLFRRNRRSGPVGDAAAVAVPWLLVPMVSMLAYSVLFDNVYVDRYLIFCTPAAALMAGVLVSEATRSHRASVASAGVVVFLTPLVLASVPSYLLQRTEWDKSGGMDYSSVADHIATVTRPGDCVAFQSEVSWAPSSLRVAKDARPDAFAGLDDIGLGVPAQESDLVWDSDATITETARRSERCTVVWVVADADRAVEERRLHSANVMWVFEPSNFRSSPLFAALSEKGFRENGRAVFDHSQVVRMVGQTQ